MTVHFVYRSHYLRPTGLHRRRFDDATVLDWFRARWEAIPESEWDRATERMEEHLGCDVYTFERLFVAIAERGLPPPRTARQLAEVLESALYIGEIKASPHLIQVLTDDDEIELAWYFFDDQYLAKHARRAAFLLHDDWKLPADVGPGGFRPAERTTQVGKAKGAGATYLVFHDVYDSGSLDGLEGGYRIDGIRLPELARYLARESVPDLGCCFHYDMAALRSQLFPAKKRAKDVEETFLLGIRDHPEDDAAWLIFADWLAERGMPSPGAHILRRALEGVTRQPLESYPGWKVNPKKSLVQVDEHVAVLCRHVGLDETCHQWYLFDDLWASAHPDLANALLRYAGRWDPLTP